MCTIRGLLKYGPMHAARMEAQDTRELSEQRLCSDYTQRISTVSIAVDDEAIYPVWYFVTTSGR